LTVSAKFLCRYHLRSLTNSQYIELKNAGALIVRRRFDFGVRWPVSAFGRRGLS